jgi:hypothetical protein
MEAGLAGTEVTKRGCAIVTGNDMIAPVAGSTAVAVECEVLSLKARVVTTVVDVGALGMAA